ncbi:hypothetical protein [Caldimonas brevitalea]|uniref:Uncharacterized protein n=1 Tax=Caldimonas brevitalea TaxID=413882 RepID=A0A0G3BUG8_9BURK|nr:hypothetical protein [Caldimonas brevitalea]AKJ30180.1 hypothetical protein AAW51_3489 [Caldimonas brevitalea]
MADLARELEHLAETDRQIAAAQAQIAAVEATAEKLAGAGADCAQTEKLLATMRDSVATFVDQRRLIAETIEDIRAGRR